ncbi:hypothetical protein HDF11_001151 [Tunturiibacter psychrotolerans]
MQTEGSEGSKYVRTVIRIQTSRVVIIMSSGDTTIVVIIPKLA